jgi:hypothetical protein
VLSQSRLRSEIRNINVAFGKDIFESIVASAYKLTVRVLKMKRIGVSKVMEVWSKGDLGMHESHSEKEDIGSLIRLEMI